MSVVDFSCAYRVLLVVVGFTECSCVFFLFFGFSMYAILIPGFTVFLGFLDIE